MSAIAFNVSRDQAMIAVDTMCTNEEGLFSHHVSKALPIPHLNIVVAGTGSLDLIERFALALNSRAFASHDEVALHASDALAVIWEDWRAALGESSTGANHHVQTSTIFQFGFSSENDTFEAIQYHSGNGFKVERMTNVTAHKPPAPLLGEPRDDDLSELFRIVASQRIHQDSKPFDSRVHIGGDVLVFTVCAKGIAIHNIGSLEG